MAPLLSSNILTQTALVVGSANFIGFLLSAGLQTHVVTDLIGVGSFVLATLRLSTLQKHGQLWMTPLLDNRLLLLNSLIGLWGTRLAGYLFHRINFMKEDKRLEAFYPAPGEGYFDKSKSNFPVKLASFWGIQALWGFVAMLPVTLLNSASDSLRTVNSDASVKGLYTVLSLSHSAGQLFRLIPRSLYSSSTVVKDALYLGSAAIVSLPIITLAGGIIIESVADYQKYKFKSDPKNENHWCDVGLWKLSRFPNYFGEMVVWWSAFATVLPAFLLLPETAVSGASRFTAVALSALSPLFISGLLTNISGVPLHDSNNQKRFGNDPLYQEYVRNTPTFVPKLCFDPTKVFKQE
jgi:steroid 5-alpha reductase family enzyme